MKILDVLPHVKVIEAGNMSIKGFPLCFNHFVKRLLWCSFLKETFTLSKFSYFCSLEIHYFSTVSVGIMLLHKEV